MIQLNQDTIQVDFKAPFDLESYQVFLQSKKLPEYNLAYDWQTDSYRLQCPSRFAHIFGLQQNKQDREWLSPNPNLFDYQSWIVYDLALPAKRYAIWLDTGLGKAFIMLELARQILHKTQGRVLTVTPLSLIHQTIEESQKFYSIDYPQITILESKTQLKEFCCGSGPGLAIINPEKFIPRKDESEIISECQWLTGCLLDEASILKTSGGKIKWALVKSCRGVEYKYTFTATPAPNETMEYASQGSFLEKLRDEGEIIWTFFSRNKGGEWKVKEHAREAFYRFLSGWSIYMRNPAHYGFRDHLAGLPDPVVKEYQLKPTREQLDHIQAIPQISGQFQLFANDTKLEMVHRIKYSELAKGFIYKRKDGNRETIRVNSRKPQFCADLALHDMREGLKVLIWTIFDEESVILFELLHMKGHVEGFKTGLLTGKIPQKHRVPIIDQFRRGEIDCLITKADLLGYGHNFQVCGSNIISGFTDSEEQRYQLERRSYRFGQDKAVRLHYPYVPELEEVVYANINRKRDRINSEVKIMENNYINALKEKINVSRG